MKKEDLLLLLNYSSVPNPVPVEPPPATGSLKTIDSGSQILHVSRDLSLWSGGLVITDTGYWDLDISTGEPIFAQITGITGTYQAVDSTGYFSTKFPAIVSTSGGHWRVKRNSLVKTNFGGAFKLLSTRNTPNLDREYGAIVSSQGAFTVPDGGRIGASSYIYHTIESSFDGYQTAIWHSGFILFGDRRSGTVALSDATSSFAFNSGESIKGIRGGTNVFFILLTNQRAFFFNKAYPDFSQPTGITGDVVSIHPFNPNDVDFVILTADGVWRINNNSEVKLAIPGTPLHATGKFAADRAGYIVSTTAGAFFVDTANQVQEIPALSGQTITGIDGEVSNGSGYIVSTNTGVFTGDGTVAKKISDISNAKVSGSQPMVPTRGFVFSSGTNIHYGYGN